MDVISILKEIGVRRFEGFLTIFNFCSEEGTKELPLYYWENPFILASVKTPEENLSSIDFVIHGVRYNVKRAQFIGDSTIEGLSIELSNENQQKFILEWDGKELLIFSTIYPGYKRRIEVYTTFLIPFRKAMELLRKGYPLVREKFVFTDYDEFFWDEAKEKLSEKIYEKLVHPINLKTTDVHLLYSGIREISDPIILSTRIASYSLDILATLERVYERTKGLKLGESSEEIELIAKVSELFWLERPQLRGDPILPEKDSFTELLLSIWNNIKDIVDDKERLRTALNVVKSELDISEVILRFRGLLES